MEAGNITLIGATTENPSFEVIAPLLSRTRVYVLQALSTEQIEGPCSAGPSPISERGLGSENISISDEAIQHIAALLSGGDARAAYNTLEAGVRAVPSRCRRGDRASSPENSWRTCCNGNSCCTTKQAKSTTSLISALHKSVRNSDPDASLYWLVRMLESGEDPLYIARRLVRMASEDIGLAEPGALAVTVAAMQAADFIGPPEGNLALAQAAVYLSLAPKSNALYTGYGSVTSDFREGTRAEPVPFHLRNAATGLMKNLGYGKGYQYAHNEQDKVTAMACLPESLAGKHLLTTHTDQGFEARLRQRMEEIRRIKDMDAENGMKKFTTKLRQFGLAGRRARSRHSFLPSKFVKFLGDTQVHDHETSRSPRALGGLFVLHTFLHPHRARPDAYGGIDDFGNQFRAAKDIHDVDFFRNVFKARVAFLTEHFSFIGIDRNDAIAGRLKILRNPKTGAIGF